MGKRWGGAQTGKSQKFSKQCTPTQAGPERKEIGATLGILLHFFFTFMLTTVLPILLPLQRVTIHMKKRNQLSQQPFKNNDSIHLNNSIQIKTVSKSFNSHCIRHRDKKMTATIKSQIVEKSICCNSIDTGKDA